MIACEGDVVTAGFRLALVIVAVLLALSAMEGRGHEQARRTCFESGGFPQGAPMQCIPAGDMHRLIADALATADR